MINKKKEIIFNSLKIICLFHNIKNKSRLKLNNKLLLKIKM